MRVEIAENIEWSEPGELAVLAVLQGRGLEHPLVAGLDRRLQGALGRIAREESFRGKLGQSLSLDTLGQAGPRRVVLLGLGEPDKVSLETVRRHGGRAADWARRYRAGALVLACCPPPGAGFELEEMAGALLEGFQLGLYRFDKYKSTEEDDQPQYQGPETVRLFPCGPEGALVGEEGKLAVIAAHAAVVAESVALARDLVNEIPEVLTPRTLADRAQRLAGEIEGLECLVLDEEAMASHKLQASLAVGRGSASRPCLIQLDYRPVAAPAVENRLVLVGKGVTFDSGGLNLKPGEFMSTMKMDMAGAAAVIASIAAIARLRLPLRVSAVVVAVENMPGGKAYHPDDVVRAMNGTTIEVGNTDAEGRLTLADALSWAVTKLEAGMIIDLATLTGACVVGLGPFTAGAMGNERDWLSLVLRAAEQSGEKCHELPLDPDMADSIKSEIADVKNVGPSRWGGSIVGGLFLERFVGKKPWVHLDIAGPAWSDKRRHYQSIGGTGYGVRLLIRLVENLVRDEAVREHRP